MPLEPVADQSPHLYVRHNLTDDGTTHAPPLSSSPDIIVKNNTVANPQDAFSIANSIASAMESDPYVRVDQANYVYLRIWNRGARAAENVFANVYWSPPATLVTPPLWNLIGGTCLPSVPLGSLTPVTTPGIVWPAERIPGPGHYCFVATVGNGDKAAPTPDSFNGFEDFVNYIVANNNIAWRNFNVIIPGLPIDLKSPFLDFLALPFLLSSAWDEAHAFSIETAAELPTNGHLALQVAEWIGRGLKPAPSALTKYDDGATDPKNPDRVRIPLEPHGAHSLGEISLPKGTLAPSHLLVHIPTGEPERFYDVSIRQLYAGREVGRITWRLMPESMPGAAPLSSDR